MANNAGLYVTLDPSYKSASGVEHLATSESYEGSMVSDAASPARVCFFAGFTRLGYNPGGGQGVVIGKAHWDAGFN